ncbi:MAG: YncE family protein [Bacteroidales bacterium]|nr:YncE family protein [Bacteroidales bacterium]
MKHLYNLLALVALLSTLITACSKDDPIIDGDDDLPSQTVTAIDGFYLLNQGNMNTNTASLDFYDFTSGKYQSNVFSNTNPEAVLGLGDVGNDLAIYGSKLYAVINKSSKVEIMDAKTAKRIKVVDVDNARFITFAEGKAYVSAYGSSLNGFVAEIDTATFEISRTVEVGRQPEQLAVVDGKIYVANAGWASAPDYETSLSVIDLNSFSVINKIEVGTNLLHVKADEYGDLYVSSQGDFGAVTSKLLVVDTKTDMVKKTFDVPVANLTIVDDLAYIVSSTYDWETYSNITGYHQIDVKNEVLLNGSFLPKSISDEIKSPSALAVDPASKFIYIADALDYASPGKLYCINKDGDLQFTKVTGNVPASIAFRYTTTKK